MITGSEEDGWKLTRMLLGENYDDELLEDFRTWLNDDDGGVPAWLVIEEMERRRS